MRANLRSAKLPSFHDFHARKLLLHPNLFLAFNMLRVQDKLQLQTLPGTLRHYGQFCRNFNTMARPLYDLLRNNASWV